MGQEEQGSSRSHPSADAQERSPLSDALVEQLYAALERAWCKGREGPYGLYNYESHGWATPHHVRDFRDPALPTYGDCAFKSTDPKAAEAEYERLTRRHIITAVIGAYEAARANGPRVAAQVPGESSREAP